MPFARPCIRLNDVGEGSITPRSTSSTTVIGRRHVVALVDRGGYEAVQMEDSLYLSICGGAHELSCT